MKMSAENGGVSSVLNLEKCSVILLDVAGTTTSINFVKDTLLKYAVEHAEAFLKEKWEDGAVKEAIKQLKDAELDVAGAVEIVKDLTEKNDANKGLKAIQGLIYEKGYNNGDIKAHVFDDVPSCLETSAKSRKICIYSTGSVDAQKLLFAHTTEGDLTSHISNYFDQSVAGAKTEKESYEKIAKELDVAAENILFVSDNVDEIKAAKSAGLIVAVIEREGNEPLTDETKKDFTVVTSFKDLTLDNSGKRKIDEEPAATEAPPSKVAKTETTEEKTDAEKTEEKPAETVETMEVDAGSAQTTSDEKTETKTEPETEQKTEEVTAEKTETNEAMDTTEEAKVAEPEVVKEKEEADKPEAVAESTEPAKKPETEVKEVAAEDKKETVVEEAKKEEEKEAKVDGKMETDAAATPVEEKKIEKEEVKAVEPEKTKEAEPTEKSEENGEVAAEKEKTEETPPTVDEKPVEEAKPATETTTATTTTTDKKPEAKEEEKVEEPSAKVEETTSEKPKEDETSEKTEESKESKKEEEKPEANGVQQQEEKENKSELANGLENGNSESVNGAADEKTATTNGDEAKNGDDAKKVDDSEIKVKKLDETAESAPVAVEV